MPSRTIICFPIEDAPGLRAEAAQLALGLAACGHTVCALGPLGAWRHVLRRAQVTATEMDITAAREVAQLVQKFAPTVIHTFGNGASRALLPLTRLVGAGGAATLSHGDFDTLTSADYRFASTIFVPCEHLHDLVSRRLPASVSVVVTGHLLPPADTIPAAQRRFLADELGVHDGMPLVLLADHFLGEETEVALAVIAAMPTLNSHLRGVQLLIVGDGPRLGELETQAAAMNNRLKRRAVVLPGHCDDISRLLSLATVAVGSGRFAQEALAAGVALVAAGAAGMVGAVTPETASVARFSCSGRHGHLESATSRSLATEIAGLFAYPQYRAQFAHDGQAAVLAESERSVRAAQIASYYQQTTNIGDETRAPQRITVILPEDLRELLFTLPAISGVRAQYPLSQLRLVTTPVHKSFLEQLGIAETVLLTPATAREWLPFLRRQWSSRADICLSYRGNFSSALMTASTLAPSRVGFADSGGSLFYSDHLHARTSISPSYALTLMQSLGVSTGAPVSPPTLLPKTEEMVNLSLLAAGVEYQDALLLLCPQAEDGLAWPTEQWVALAELLRQSRPERVAVLGAPQTTWPDGVVKVMPVQDSLVLATLLARATVVIAADSAPLHLADLLGVPTIGLFGPTDPTEHRLPNTRCHALRRADYACQPCQSPCPDHRCMQALTPPEVAHALDALLASSGSVV